MSNDDFIDFKIDGDKVTTTFKVYSNGTEDVFGNTYITRVINLNDFKIMLKRFNKLYEAYVENN